MKFDPDWARDMYETGEWSHRGLARFFGVSLRKIQETLSPEQNKNYASRARVYRRCYHLALKSERHAIASGRIAQ